MSNMISKTSRSIYTKINKHPSQNTNHQAEHRTDRNTQRNNKTHQETKIQLKQRNNIQGMDHRNHRLHPRSPVNYGIRPGPDRNLHQDTFLAKRIQQPMEMKKIINQQINHLKRIYNQQNTQTNTDNPPKY